jgi:hypothetical protein
MKGAECLIRYAGGTPCYLIVQSCNYLFMSLYRSEGFFSFFYTPKNKPATSFTTFIAKATSLIEDAFFSIIDRLCSKLFLFGNYLNSEKQEYQSRVRN